MVRTTSGPGYMVRRRPDSGEETKKDGGLRAWVRDALVAVIIVGVVFGGIFAYTRVWPPLVVIESSSMQHGHAASAIGVIDTGDLVLVQSSPARADIVTWVEGRVSGHSTYGDYGDVIVFRKPTDPDGGPPVIHRAILYLVPNTTVPGTYDIPDLEGFPSSEWEARGANWTRVVRAQALRDVTIHGMGYRRDLGITFNLTVLAIRVSTRGEPGYVTMGDNNAYDQCLSPDPCGPSTPYDAGWVVPQTYVIGRARGEIPWFGLIKLTVSPTDSCCQGWGDTKVPSNSWDSLAISLIALVSLPFALEGVGLLWRRILGPRLRPGPAAAEPAGDGEDSGPRSGSSEP